MAKTETMNVLQKLAQARLAFLNEHIDKSGKNMQLEFKYFELDDIVPKAIRIFADFGLLAVSRFDPEAGAIMDIYNADDPQEMPVTFRIPYKENEPIYNKSGAAVTNNLQTLGSSITYLRRYLWMAVLDVTEPDSIDDHMTNGKKDDTQTPVKEEFAEEKKAVEERKEEKVKTPKKSTKKPATAADRSEAKKALTADAKDENASEEEMEQMKDVCRKILSADEEQEEFIQSVALKTNGFQPIEKSIYKPLMEALTQMLEEYKEVKVENE